MGFTSQEYVLPFPFSPGTDLAEKERAGRVVLSSLQRLEDPRGCRLPEDVVPRLVSEGFSLALNAALEGGEVIPSIGVFPCWLFQAWFSPSSVPADLCTPDNFVMPGSQAVCASSESLILMGL